MRALGEWRIVVVDGELDHRLPLVRDVDVLHGADRGATGLNRVALHELTGVQEVGVDCVAATTATEQEHCDEDASRDHCRYGGSAPDRRLPIASLALSVRRRLPVSAFPPGAREIYISGTAPESQLLTRRVK